MIRKTFIIYVLGLMATSTANAETTDYYTECINKYDYMNNMVVHTCSEYADTHYKKVINTNYNKIYKALKRESSEDANNFEKAQQGWLQYRNNHCNLAGRYIGSPMYSYCPQQINHNRAMELEQLAESF